MPAEVSKTPDAILYRIGKVHKASRSRVPDQGARDLHLSLGSQHKKRLPAMLLHLERLFAVFTVQTPSVQVFRRPFQVLIQLLEETANGRTFVRPWNMHLPRHPLGSSRKSEQARCCHCHIPANSVSLHARRSGPRMTCLKRVI